MLLQRSTKLINVIRISNIRNLSNKDCIFTKINRTKYLRQYPTLLVQPDGSTITIRHEVPRAIIRLPVDISKLSDEERAIVMEMRKPKKKVLYKQEETINYDHNIYLNMLKKK